MFARARVQKRRGSRADASIRPYKFYKFLYTISKEYNMKTQPLKGMRDLLPREQALRDYIQGQILSLIHI